jgi:hypothetical protein
VLDYKVYYDQGLSIYVQLAEGIKNTYYTTQVPLTPGIIYSFKITARNDVGSSDQSEAIAILAAKNPDPPIAL